MATIRASRGANHSTRGRLAVGTTALLVGLLTMGVAAAGPIATLTPTSLNFGGVKVNVLSATKTITVKNTGNATLTIGTVALTGALKGHFAKKSDTCTGKAKAIGTTCAIGIAFKPLSMGTKTAAVSIPTNAGTKSAPLSGIGLAAVAVFDPATWNFGEIQGCAFDCDDEALGDIRPNETDPKNMTIRSTGNIALIIQSVTMTGPGGAADDFRKTADNCSSKTIAVGASCTVSIKFKPATVAGNRQVVLSLTSNHLGTPPKATLSGVATDADNPYAAFTVPSVGQNLRDTMGPTLKEAWQYTIGLDNYWRIAPGQALAGSAGDRFSGIESVAVRFKKHTDQVTASYSPAAVTCSDPFR